MKIYYPIYSEWVKIIDQTDVILAHADFLYTIFQEGQITDKMDVILAHADLLSNIPRHGQNNRSDGCYLSYHKRVK